MLKTLPYMKPTVVESGLCRCCGSVKRCRVLSEEYTHMGTKEVYSDMIMDCFGLLLSNIDGDEADRLVCATCVVKLREAYTFKRQVLKCEEQLFIKMQEAPVSSLKVEIKIEENDEFPEDAELSCDYENQNEKEVQRSKRLLSMPTPIIIPKNASQITDENKTTLKGSEKTTKKTTAQSILKRDLYRNMQKLKSLLNKKEPGKPKQQSRPGLIRQRSKSTEQTDKDILSYHNTITLVKYSYACPFKNRISNYYCFYCKEIFTDPYELRQHTLVHNPQHFPTLTDHKRKVKIDITKIDCRLCSEKIDSLDAFKKHITSVHRKKYHEIQDSFLKFRLESENLECLECGKRVHFIDKLIVHMTDHFGKYVCEVCGMCFIEETSVTQHMRSHNKAKTTFPCDKCGKELKSNYSRFLHIATVHEKRPVVACYKCDSSFLSYAQRNRHLINAHGDNRKYPCRQCEKVFDVRKTMMEHVRKYHAQVIYRHECEVCGQRYVSQSKLKEHLSIHGAVGGFNCEFCDKTYQRKQSLVDHLKTHTSAPFKCIVCNIEFEDDVGLKSHLKCHQEGYNSLGFIM